MTANSLGRYSEIGITTVQAFMDKITSISGTTVTIEDYYGYLNDDHDEGSFVMVSSTVTAQDYIEDISSVDAAANKVILDSSINGMAVGDEIAIIPKPLVYLCLESESIKETINWDDTECLQSWESTHHTPLTVDTGGDLGVFIGEESQALDCILAATLGETSAAAGLVAGSLHTYWPGDTVEYLTVVIQRGNHVSLQAYCGMMVDTLVLDQPAGGMGTARVTLTGGFGIQEIGGSGKTFSTGAGNFWNPPASPPDPKRMHFKHLVVSAASVPKKYVESGNITFARNPAVDRRLGDYYVHEPASGRFETTGQIVQWFENDAELTEWRGGNVAIGDPTPFDLQYKWTGTATTGTYLQIDAYDVVYQDSSEPIVEGKIKETLTWKAKFDTGEGKQVLVTYENKNASPS